MALKIEVDIEDLSFLMVATDLQLKRCRERSNQSLYNDLVIEQAKSTIKVAERVMAKLQNFEQGD